MELEPPPFHSENLFVPTTTFPRLDHSTPQLQNGHFSSSFSSSSLLLLFWGKGRGRPKTAGPVRPMRGSTGCQGAAIGWLGRPCSLSSCLASSSSGHRPSVLAHSPQRFHQKRNQLGTWPSGPLTQNAGTSCLFLQILRASSKFWIFRIIDNNLHQFRGRRRLKDLSVNIRMQTGKNLPHLHLRSPPPPLGK